MGKIDKTNWSRREQFELYKEFDHPHFSLCAKVEITDFYSYVKKSGLPFTVSLVYLLSRTANELSEFRQRIRGDVVLEHELVHPSYTLMTPGDLFTFCTVPYVPDFATFAEAAAAIIADLRQHPTLKDEPGKDDLLFMTAIPWVSFTSFSHPMHLQPADSVPRFAWGKYLMEGKRLLMPLDVQVHHALMDGFHVGKYYSLLQDFLDSPETVLAGAGDPR